MLCTPCLLWMLYTRRHFMWCAANTKFTLVVSSETPRINNISYRKYLNCINRDHTIFLFTSDNEVKIVYVIRSFKKTGLAFMIFQCLFSRKMLLKITNIITFICNNSLTTGVHPKGLAVARIACIFKAG